MFRRSFGVFKCLTNIKLRNDISEKNAVLLTLSRGFSNNFSVDGQGLISPFLSTKPLQDTKCSKPFIGYFGFGILFPSLTKLNYSPTPTNYEQIVNGSCQKESGRDVENKGDIWMGSLLKKRRRKMNRQKYKKRRKRDWFKREALKNLRERKLQRKKRAAERKQEILSNMVVNKSISKRRARYLSHKLLPGVIKGQGLI